MIAMLLDKLRDTKRRKTWPADAALGRRGEDLAHRFLRKRGFTIVARNYRLAAGDAEADLIARECDEDGEQLVIVEVKSRATGEFGPPDRAISEEKRAALIRVAREYAKKAEVPWNCVRFDVVSVVCDPPRIEHHRDAFRPAK